MVFCLQSIYYWFVLYSRRNLFQLPIHTKEDFLTQYESTYYVQWYINASSIAVVSLCVKALRILMIFVPAFGLLFDTFRKSKYDLIYFFIMVFVFLLGFLFAGMLFFGFQDYFYKDVGTGLMSLFRIIVGEFKLQELQIANPSWAAPFFILYVICFFIIFLNLLLTIFCEVYDQLRKKKALDSEARAKILSKEQVEYIMKWIDLIICRSNERSSLKEQNSEDEIYGDYEKNKNSLNRAGTITDSQLYIQRQMSIQLKKQLKEKKDKKDIKTICLHNKAKIFQAEKTFKTKEQMENELKEMKKQIIEKKLEEREERIRRFQVTDTNSVRKFRSSIIYLIFIVNFVFMISNQLQITSSGQAQASLKDFIMTRNFTELKYYTPFGQTQVQITPDMPLSMQLQYLPNDTVSAIFFPPQLEDWLTQSLYEIIYQDDVIIRQNYLFGDIRAKITFRRAQMYDNNNTYTQNVISKVRKIDMLDFTDPPNQDEIRQSFSGYVSGRTYQYVKAGTTATYNQMGGYVIKLPLNSSQGFQILQDMVRDKIVNETLANMAIEFVTYNPNYHYYVISAVTFQQSAAGMIYPITRCRAINKRLYATSSDRFKAFQEILYLIFIICYLTNEIYNFILTWIKVVKQDNEKKVISYSCDDPSFLEKLAVFLDFSYSSVDNKGCWIMLILLIFYSLKWLCMQVIRTIRVLYKYIGDDFFKLFNLISISLSLTLIGTWFYIILNRGFYLDGNGFIETDLGGTGYIDNLSDLSNQYDTYNLYSSVNTLIIFWRILQFFSFSFKLSAFTEILASSKQDIFYFFFMFIIALFGFAVMGYSIFGQSTQKYSNIFFTIIMEFRMMIEDFDFDSMLIWNSTMAAPFFVIFMLLFDQIIKNMFIAIIVAHYKEFHAMGFEKTGVALEEAENTPNETHAVKVFFQAIKITLCPDFLFKYQKRNKGVACYVNGWNKLEDFLFRVKEQVEREITEEIRELEEVLTKKYQKPDYGMAQLHNFLRPFVIAEEEKVDFEGESESGVDLEGQVSLKKQKEIAEEREREKQARYNGENQENSVLMVNYIDILPKTLEGLSEEELSSANIWVAALEKTLFNQSHKEILFSDLHEVDDIFGRCEEFGLPAYDVSTFSKLQSEFMMADNQERVDIWLLCKPNEKYALWQSLDFEKVLEDENILREVHHERLEDFIDIINELKRSINWVKPAEAKSGKQDQRRGTIGGRNMAKRGIPLDNPFTANGDWAKKIPIMSFKKIFQSPEYLDQSFSQASMIQKHLWCNCTSDEEKYLLWFHFMTPYYQTKLWNSLSFSEDYMIAVMNTPKFYRQDLTLKVTEALYKIKEEYVIQCKVDLAKLKGGDMNQTQVNNKTIAIQKKKVDKTTRHIQKLMNGEIKLEDVAKKASFDIRTKYLTADFFLECLELLKSRKYKVYKKIQSQHFKSNRLLDSMLNETLRLQKEAIQEEKESTPKKRSQSTRLQESPSAIKDLAKELQRLKKLKTESAGMLTLHNQRSSMSQAGSGNYDSVKKLNITTDKFERSVNDTLVGQAHTRGPSQIPLLDLANVESQNRNNTPTKIMKLATVMMGGNSPKGKENGAEQEILLKLQEQGQKNIIAKALFFDSKKHFEKTQTAKKGHSKENESDVFEEKKINKRTHIECLKFYFDLMVHGVDGKRLKYLKENFTQDDQYETYKHLLHVLDKNEERLSLWLAMSEDQKLKFLGAQSNVQEAEVITRFLVQEVERSAGSQYKMAEIDRKLERALDNQTYEKYRRLTEWQALKTTSNNIDKRFGRLKDEDRSILELIGYLGEKQKTLQTRQKFLYKEIFKRYKENQLWRQSYDNKKGKLKQD